MTSKTVSALCVFVIIAGSVVAESAPATAGLPANATPVHVTSGVVTTGIDASVTQLGGVAGRITSAKGGEPVGRAVVRAVDAHGRLVVQSRSQLRDSGRYLLPSLTPTNPYRICVVGTPARGGGSTTGYLSRCYKSAADPVTVSAGAKTGGIDIALPSAAGIAGTVTDDDGTAVANVPVIAKNLDTGRMFNGETGRAGKYLLKGLTPASTGYAVCFVGHGRGGPRSPTGYLDECWRNHGWSGRRIPNITTPVSVRLAKIHKGIDVVLKPAGAIAGRLIDRVTGKPIAGRLAIFNASGGLLRKKFARTGHYLAKGLPATRRDYVCAIGPFYSGLSYRKKCYKHSHWSGVGTPSSDLTEVGVRLGRVHRGIDLALGRKLHPKQVRFGAIAGVITSGVDGTTPIPDADVLVIDPHVGALIETSTSRSGAYSAPGLPENSTGYIVCASARGLTRPTPPTGGWAPRCYKDALWDGGRRVSPRAVKVPVVVGQTKTGIDITLPVGGAITGHVTVTGTTDVATVFVETFRASTGRRVALDVNDFVDGSYTISGLTPGKYIVCFDGRQGSDSAPYGTQPQCYDGVAWRPPGLLMG